MPKAKKTITKAVAVEKNISVAMEKISLACTDGDRAVVARARTSKQLTAEVRKLNKKRGTLLRRKVTAAKRVAREGSAANRKALTGVVKELATTRKALAKARELKKVNTAELGALKIAQRKANGYLKAIDKVDRTLNKPKKRGRR